MLSARLVRGEGIISASSTTYSFSIIKPSSRSSSSLIRGVLLTSSKGPVISSKISSKRFITSSPLGIRGLVVESKLGSTSNSTISSSSEIKPSSL